MGFEHAGAVLKQTHGDLIIAKQKLRKIEGIELIRRRQDQGQENLGFTSRPFVLCGLPLRRPPKDHLIYERRNGHFKLQITGHPEFGLPFGQDRFIPIFLATLAVRQQSRTVRFKSGAAVLEMFGLSKGARSIAESSRDSNESSAQRSSLVPRQSMAITGWFIAQGSTSCGTRIWYEGGGGGDDNIVVLSEEFYAEVLAHLIPFRSQRDPGTCCFAGSPGPFLWLSYRGFTTKTRTSIPLFGPIGLAAQLGCVEYSRPRRFRSKLSEWLDEIRMIWPDCPAALESSRLVITPRTMTKAV